MVLFGEIAMNRLYRHSALIVLGACAGISAPTRAYAQPPKVLEVRVQDVNQTRYFHVRFQRPSDLREDADWMRRRGFWWEDFGRWRDPWLSPQLVPQDGQAIAVYSWNAREFFDGERFPGDFKDAPKVQEKGDPKDGPPPAEQERKAGPGGAGGTDGALEFVGKVIGKDQVTFRLIYPKETRDGEKRPGKTRTALKKLLKPHPSANSLNDLLQERYAWAEVDVTLDFSKAKSAPAPAAPRQPKQPDPKDGLPNRPNVNANDLEGLWASAQAMQFALHQAHTSDFGFYGQARILTARKYRVADPNIPWAGGPEMLARDPGFDKEPRTELGRQFEITTGAAAITESLALNRLRDRRQRGDLEKQEARTVPIGNVRGIDIDAHDWVKMLGDKKPVPEPLARLVPRDNYYVHFKTIAKFLEAGDLLDEWGSTLIRAYEVNCRDYRLKERLEQQLCLKSTGLARLLGPAVVKGMAVTGSDPYIREGTDVTIIFQLANKTLFSAGVSPVLQATRDKFGPRVRESKAEHGGVAIESAVTELREVSMHRAFVDDYAIYSNSLAGLRRVIDAYQGKLPCLADALDFQYMRTIFRLDDPAEDGFVFLSDPFIRNLVGPATRIKERRRLEGLTSLHMAQHAALFAAWETGRLPRTHDELLQVSGLRREELVTPSGESVFWHLDKKCAVSSVYNTLHFATPLVELPMDQVTPTEAREYEMFRLQYLGLWRQYFDPIGMRLSLRKEDVRWETYILPLVRTSQYNRLRVLSGDATISVDSGFFGNKTLVQLLFSLSPRAAGQEFGFGFGRGDWMTDLALFSWLGDWFTIRADDSPIYAQLMESWIRQQIAPDAPHDFVDDLERVFQLPITVGLDIREPMVFAGLLTSVRKAVQTTMPDAVDWAPLEPYKGVHIVKIQARPEGQLARELIGRGGKRRFSPALYYALIDRGFYLSFQEAPLKDLIDRSASLKDGKAAAAGDKTELNSAIYLAPRAAIQAKPLLRQYLEWETHRRVQTNQRLLYALYRSGVVSPADSSTDVEAAALQYLGFVPVSPDLAPSHFDPKKDEVVNDRHGTLRQPRLHPGVEPTSPVGRLMEQMGTIRADLRFREDGVHTVVTIRREK
jgi:hypothetical protein